MAETTGRLTSAALVGGGVIGSGWLARFVLNGVDVRMFDPDPEAERKVTAVLDNARAAHNQLFADTKPAEGSWQIVDNIADAVTGAPYIVESVPERLEIKHDVYRQIEAAANPDAIITSSTSGFKPSDLQRGAAEPGRIIVAHPFNPVYLLPLVELVGGPHGNAAIIERAAGILTGLGMKPLKVRKEIDAFIADRLLEAVWREALWLVKDGVATTSDIDDAIRMGFGLRWAQMGLFETYRIAGGEAGIRHFLAQFGPSLKWPWTKLMDVPDLDQSLVDEIASQSDEQSGAHSIRDLERIRDTNIVGILKALQANDWGAGTIIAQHQKRLDEL